MDDMEQSVVSQWDGGFRSLGFEEKQLCNVGNGFLRRSLGHFSRDFN